MAPVPGWFQIGAGVALLGSCVWSAALAEIYRWMGRGEVAGVVVVVLVYLVVLSRAPTTLTIRETEREKEHGAFFAFRQ